MKFNVVTIFPDIFDTVLQYGVIGRGLKKGLSEVNIVSLREFATDKHQSVDWPVYGGKDGMLMGCEPLGRCVDSLKQDNPKRKIVYLSPQGKAWSNSEAQAWAQSNEDVVLICGRYAGVDQRFIEHYVDEEISVGDYVLSGGEVAAQILIDTTMRFIPGVLGDERSPVEESLENNRLEAPQYTRPPVYKNMEVPEVLRSGHHRKIKDWCDQAALIRTFHLRPDLLGPMDGERVNILAAIRFFEAAPEGELQSMGFSFAMLARLKQELSS